MSEWSLAYWHWADCSGYKCGDVFFNIVSYKTIPELMEWIIQHFNFSRDKPPRAVIRVRQYRDKDLDVRKCEVYVLQRNDEFIVEVDRLNTYITKHLEGPLTPSIVMSIFDDYIKPGVDVNFEVHVDYKPNKYTFTLYGVMY